MSALSKKQITHEIATNGMITDMVDLRVQAQPAGFDLTVNKIEAFMTDGYIDFSNKRRSLAGTRPLPTYSQFGTEDEWEAYQLAQGAYKLTFNERIRVPMNCLTIVQTRSSLLRSGASIHAGFGDPGFDGHYSVLLVVHNESGIEIEVNACVAQLAFLSVMEGAVPYDGIYNDPRSEDVEHA